MAVDSPLTSDRARPLRIALSIWMFHRGTGGLQSHAECLARNLIERGHSVTVITRAYSKVPEGMDFLYFREKEAESIVGGIPVRTLNFDRRVRPLLWLVAKLKNRRWGVGCAIRLYRILARLCNRDLFSGFDLVHHAGQSTALIGFAAEDGARRAGVPFIVQPTCHPHQLGDTPTDLRLYRRSDRLLAHTKYEANYLGRIIRDVPCDVVGNGIEDRSDGVGERFRSSTGISGPILLFLGRREEDKGLPVLLEAFQTLRGRYPDLSLVCMGPPGTVEVESGGGIHLMEFVEESVKHDALAACTCFCVPTEGESFGLVFMEAARYGKPIVARRLPVLEELFEGGGAAMLPGRPNYEGNSAELDAEELVAALDELLGDSSLQKELGESGRTVSENFVWARVVDCFLESYRTVLS